MLNWYCIYTKPKQEEAVARKLKELLGLEVFNPQIRTKKYSRSRLVERVEGLFPCYLFSRLDPAKYSHTVTYTRGVRRFVGDASGIPYVVDPAIIKDIKLQMHHGFISTISIRSFCGHRVQVEDGPFGGLKGLCIGDLRPSDRVLVLLDAIQYQAKLDISREMISRG